VVVACFLVLAVCFPVVTFYHFEAESVYSYPVHNLSTGINYTSIQEAINDNQTLDGHVVLVDAGTYFENVVVNKSLSLLGVDRELTIVDGGGSGVVVNVTADSVVITHFTVRNSGAYYPNSGVCLCRSNFSSVTDNIIELGNYGVLMISSNNATVSGNEIVDNVYHGVVMNNSCNNTVSWNNLAGNGAEAVNLFQSGYNLLSWNNFSGNAAAVWMDEAHGNVFSNNCMRNCTVAYLPVMAIMNSVGNCFVGNDIDNLDGSSAGFALNGSNETVIVENNIARCGSGFYLSSSNRNRIYHNNVVNVAYDAHVFEVSTENVWDDGYPSGGNCWSYYAGADVYQGSGQNVSGSDGIGDANYTIDVDNVDRYPLKGMFCCFNVSSGYDVQTVCNSTISDFRYNGTALVFNVTGVEGSAGFCRLCVPTGLMNVSYRVFVNGTEVACNLLLCSNSTHSYLYFDYAHSTQEVVVIPEFPMFLVLPLFFAWTLFAAVIRRRMNKG
jgi:parallel beta-helix repeat protein